MHGKSRISVVVVEDEYLARERILKLIRDESDLTVVGEAATGPDAIEKIETHRPDLVMIDIALPQLNAFEVLAAVDGPLPLVVFMTAFDQYAVRAFDINAVDYLLKPVERERLARAIEHVRRRLAAGDSGFTPEVLRRLGTTIGTQRLVVRSGERLIVLAPRDIEFIEAVGNYIKIHRSGESVLARQTLASIEERLRGDGFVRIQRSVVVNSRKISEIARETKDSSVVVLANGSRFRIGERYRDNLKAVFSEL